MVKPKQRHVPSALNVKKKKNQCLPEFDLLKDGDWTLVKLQRVTILIPPLPTKKKQPVMPLTEDESQQQEILNSSEISSPKQLVNEREKSISLSPEQVKIVHPSNSTFKKSEKPSNLPRKVISDNAPLVRPGKFIFDHNCALPSRRMRAFYLDKKLKKAGGLENWLVSIGLSRFVKIFQRKRFGKYHLANLSMEKLKEMGAEAVGPRRKLMHAIDCLCEPHCFKQS